MKAQIHQIFEKLLFTANGTCPICGKVLFSEKHYFCSRCESELPLSFPGRCTICGRPMTEDNRCKDCLRAVEDAQDGGVVLAEYTGGMQRAIAEIKYNGRRGLGRYLGQVLGGAVALQPWVHELTGIVPVPLHPHRLAERGYNQAELLAEGLVRCLETDYGMPIPLMPALNRIVDTPHQVGQGRQGRLHNLDDAFAPAEGLLLWDQTLLLVDDVLTTGATLRACAGSLRSAGAKRVYTAVAAGVFQFKS